MVNRRLQLVQVFVFGAAGLILVRLFFWQVIRGAGLAAAAEEQRTAEHQVEADRGEILAADGFPLVANERRYLLWATLSEVNEPAGGVASKLAGLLFDKEATEAATLAEREEEEKERLAELLGRKGVVWVALKHGLTEENKEQVKNLAISGLGFSNEVARFYPEASMSAHVLGFVGKDANGEGQGYFGLEGYYNLSLSGRPGRVVEEQDVAGNPILVGRREELEAVSGATLLTHVDRAVQYQVEKWLKRGIERYGAKAGSVVVMQPSTGAILAMASWPTYEPGRFLKYDKEIYANPAVGETYEPGSTFKVLVMAAALDAGVVEPETRCPVCGGPLKVGDVLIKTWNEEYRSDSTMSEVLVHSDNVGMAWVAGELGVERMVSYLDKFGIGRRTGVDLQEEGTGRLRRVGDWTSVDLAAAGFGQGVAVTPIQMVQAVGAIANGGVMMKPEVVDKLVGQGWEEEVKPEVEGRVISAETAAEITRMMVAATDGGEAKWTRLSEYEVAGKTGTAQIPVAGHYDEEKTIASFVGFAPAEKPAFVMLVSLREPESSPWGSETAAPLWFNIAREILVYMGIPGKE